MAYLVLKALAKNFAATQAVKPMDLAVEAGEFFSLLGPSGCGKSTTLRMVAGFVRPSAGVIEIKGRDVTRLPPEERDIGIVFQNYAIFPHLSVFDNIAFGLRMRKIAEAEIKKKVHASLEQVGLSGYEARFDRELSGGQRQRVALARVLVIEPQILLLDEPLSALDKKMREEMKVWIKDIQKTVGITTLYVTHDQSEALSMSDRIGVMNDGALLQVGSAEDIYERPLNRFVGEFIGESNILSGEVLRCDNGICQVKIGEAVITANVPDRQSTPHKTARVLVRPEKITFYDPKTAENALLPGHIESEVYEGSVIRYVVSAAGSKLAVEVANRADTRVFHPGDTVALGWDRDAAVVLAN